MRTLMPGVSIYYKGEKYSVGMIGRSTFLALKYPELDRSKAITLSIENDDWSFS